MDFYRVEDAINDNICQNSARGSTKPGFGRVEGLVLQNDGSKLCETAMKIQNLQS